MSSRKKYDSILSCHYSASSKFKSAPRKVQKFSCGTSAKRNIIALGDRIVIRDQGEQVATGEGVVRSSTYTIIDGEKVIDTPAFSDSEMFSKFSTFSRKKKPLFLENVDKTKEPTDDNFSRMRSTFETKQFNEPETNRFGTYRKGTLPKHIKDQLKRIEQTNEPISKLPTVNESSTLLPSGENDKFKTVTLKSFKKSFRELFLNPKQDAVPYNPSWFVPVETPSKSTKENNLEEKKRNDVIVFGNDNYRPTARSPIRNIIERQLSQSPERIRISPKSNPNPIENTTMRKTARSMIRTNQRNNNQSISPKISKPTKVQRNETFKVERETAQPVRIEIRNQRVRLVPVGIAKPMQSKNRWEIENRYSNNSNHEKSIWRNSKSPTKSTFANPTITSRMHSNSNNNFLRINQNSKHTNTSYRAAGDTNQKSRLSLECTSSIDYKDIIKTPRSNSPNKYRTTVNIRMPWK